MDIDWACIGGQDGVCWAGIFILESFPSGSQSGSEYKEERLRARLEVPMLCEAQEGEASWTEGSERKQLWKEREGGQGVQQVLGGPGHSLELYGDHCNLRIWEAESGCSMSQPGL